MSRWIPIVILVTLAAPPASAQVTLDQWGTFATLAHSDCADFCDPDVDLSWLLGLTFEPAEGGPEIPLTDATLSNTRGDAFAEASVTVPLAPEVRVDATSAAGGWVTGNGVAVQGYTYVGVAPDTIDVAVALTGTIGNPDADPATGLAAQVSYVGDANVASLVFENAVIGLVTPDGSVQLEQSADGAVNQSDVLSIPVNPGDQFYLIASSAASAGGVGAFAESLGTLSVSFDPGDAANLETPNGPPPPVQLPATGPLAVVALAAMLLAVGVRSARRR